VQRSLFCHLREKANCQMAINQSVNQYRQYIQNILLEKSQRSSKNMNFSEYEVQTIFDTERDHYQLLRVGWRNNKRDFGCVLHLDIKDDKIWIQHDSTDTGITEQLLEMGVPKEDIVLAFHEPEVRQFTGFGC
jgi:hypothetical protein